MDEGVVICRGVAQAGITVRVDVYVVDVVHLQIAAVDDDVDAEFGGRVGGVDNKMDVVVGGEVVAGFAQGVDYAATLCGNLLLVVGVASHKGRLVLGFVEDMAYGWVLRAVGNLVDEVAVRGFDVVAYADVVVVRRHGVEACRAAEAAFRHHQLSQLVGGLATALFVVDDRRFAYAVHGVVPEVGRGVRQKAVGPFADWQPFDAEGFGVGTLQVVLLGVLQGGGYFRSHRAAVGHLHIKRHIV